MPDPIDSVSPPLPAGRGTRTLRRRLGVRAELALALLPTAVVLIVMGVVERFTRQRLLFASLSASAFLIYLEPGHAANRVRTLVTAQILGAVLGFAAYWGLGAHYAAGAAAMAGTILLMVVLDAVHPPAVATSLGFAFRAGDEQNLALFAMMVAMVAVLVGMQQVSQRLLNRFSRPAGPPRQSEPPRQN